MFVHSFKPCGWHFTNFHYYYQTYRSILLRYDCPSWPPTAYSRSFSTATPTPQRRLLIGATSRHSLVCGSYFSTLDIASPLHQPPTATGKGTSSPVVNHLFAWKWDLSGTIMTPSPFSVPITVPFFSLLSLVCGLYLCMLDIASPLHQPQLQAQALFVHHLFTWNLSGFNPPPPEIYLPIPFPFFSLLVLASSFV